MNKENIFFKKIRKKKLYLFFVQINLLKKNYDLMIRIQKAIILYRINQKLQVMQKLELAKQLIFYSQ